MDNLRNNRTGVAQSRRHKARGSALTVTLIMTMVLSVIVGASLSRCLATWNDIGRSYHRDGALQVAESGVEMGIYALNHTGVTPTSGQSGLGSLTSGLTGLSSLESLSGDFTDAAGSIIGSYSVSVVPVPGNNMRRTITSTGTVPPLSVSSQSRVNRTVRVTVERWQFDADIFGAAIYTPTWIDTNGITEIHGNTISGNLIRTVGSGDPHDRVEQYEYEYFDEVTQSVQTGFGEVDEGRNMDSDPDNDVVLPFDEFTLEQFKQISISQGLYFESEPKISQMPTSFFQPDGVTPNVVFITGSIHMSGNFTIGGLIFVVGDIYSQPEDAEFGGNDIIEGIIYTTGMFRTHGGGNKSINVNGGVFCGSANMQGHAVVEYNWEYFDALKNLANASNKFRFLSWQEMVDYQG